MEIQYIGTIHSPFANATNMPIQPSGAVGVRGTIEIFDSFADGLLALDGFSHIILLYHFHRALGFSLHTTPFLDTATRGVFATRAPRRPNAIGLSVVALEKIEGNILYISNVDILDGTPLIDVKPFVPQFDCPNQPIRIGWLAQNIEKTSTHRSDDRFSKQ